MLKKMASAMFIMLLVACTKQASNNYNINSQVQTNSTAQKHYIGEHYGGGIIFYLDSTNKHGLIADTGDLPKATWFNGKDIRTEASETKIGTGRKNTKRIVAKQDSTGNYAALECLSSTRSDYNNWFLPSRDELKELFSNKNVLPNFGNSRYWSSTEDASNSKRRAWSQSYKRFGVRTYLKEDTLFVRAIREF